MELNLIHVIEWIGKRIMNEKPAGEWMICSAMHKKSIIIYLECLHSQLYSFNTQFIQFVVVFISSFRCIIFGVFLRKFLHLLHKWKLIISQEFYEITKLNEQVMDIISVYIIIHGNWRFSEIDFIASHIAGLLYWSVETV